MKIEEGVMVVKDGKGWGLVYADGRSTVYGWVNIEDAEISDPRYCKRPSDKVYQGSPDTKEISTGKLVNVVRNTFVEIKEK